MATDLQQIDQFVDAIHDLLAIQVIDLAPSERSKVNAKIASIQLLVPDIPDPTQFSLAQEAVDETLRAVIAALKRVHFPASWLPAVSHEGRTLSETLVEVIQAKIQQALRALNPYKKDDVPMIHAYIAFMMHTVCGVPLAQMPGQFKDDGAVLQKYIELSGRELTPIASKRKLWLKAYASDQQWGRFNRSGKHLVFEYVLSESGPPKSEPILDQLGEIQVDTKPPPSSALVISGRASQSAMGSVFDRAEHAVARLPDMHSQYVMAQCLYRMPYFTATPRGFDVMISTLGSHRRATRAHAVHALMIYGRSDGVLYSTLPEVQACYEAHRLLQALLQNDFEVFLQTTDQDVLSYAGELLATHPAYRDLHQPFVEISLGYLSQWPVLMHVNSTHPHFVRYVAMFQTVADIMAQHVWLERLRLRLFELIRDYVDTRIKTWIASFGDGGRQAAILFGGLLHEFGGSEGYRALCANFPKTVILKQRDMWLALFGGYALKLPPAPIWQQLRLTTLTKKLDIQAMTTLAQVAAEGEDNVAIAELKRLFVEAREWQIPILDLLLKTGTPIAFNLMLELLVVTPFINTSTAQALTATFQAPSESFALPILCAWAVEKLEKQGQTLSSSQRGFLLGLCHRSDTQRAIKLAQSK